MEDFALVHEFFDGTRDIFDEHVRVDAVLVHQVHVIGAKSLQRLPLLRPSRDLAGCSGRPLRC